MNSRAARFASVVIALMFLLAGVSQAMGNVSACSMPCCQEKSNSCHVTKERALKADDCCKGTTTSFVLGSGCGPERKDVIEFSTVSFSPTPPQGVEMSSVELPSNPSEDHISIVAAIAPPGKIPLYLQNLILLI
jgi:hypothetical protein